MQFELSFNDGISEHFGDGFERNASSSTERYTVLVLIATLAAILLWLIGAAAGAGPRERLHTRRRIHRTYSRRLMARPPL